MPDLKESPSLQDIKKFTLTNSRTKPTGNPAKYQVIDSQTTEIQISLNLTTTIKNLLKARIVMQALHQQYQLSI